ncbi:MAG: TonB-dependent receptor [Gemmatimonadaceae bacterium]|nr:TonB-dependent receptor [Gemmatimonadaceae bacterium]
MTFARPVCGLRVRAALATLAGFAFATLAAIASASDAQAQTTTGAIRGYVRDSAGTPIGDAQVIARNAAMGAERIATTNSNGFYNLAGLRPARYDLQVRRLGYSAQTRAVTVGIGEVLTLDLQLAQTATQIAGVRILSTETTETARSSESGTNVSRQQIENLPNFERNFLDIAKLVPGITASTVNNSDKFLAAGGQPAEAVNVFVDGATYKNDVLRGGVVGQDASKGNPFPQAAVQEFRVITQNYKAEYQKASSAIITATTRSGTNTWEGELFGYGIGKAYVARNPIEVLNGSPRSRYERLQAGGSLGGPIAKDKLFFFGTYELNFRDEPQYVTLGGNAAQAPTGLNPAQYTGAFTSQFREHLGFGKLTWLKSSRSTVDASLNVRTENDFRGFGGQTSYQSAEDVAIRTLTGVANWRYAGEKWLNEAQVNVQNFVWNPRPRNPGLIGRDYAGIIRIGGREGRQEFTQGRIALRNDVTRSGVQLGGDHVFKGGASIDFLGYEGIKDFFFTTPLLRYRAEENYVRPFQAQFGFGNPKISADNIQIGGYLQDDWTVTPKFTINAGIRWDIETNGINNSYVTPKALADSLRLLAPQMTVGQPTASGTVVRRPINDLGGIENFITTGRSDRPINLGAIQPRLGFSYDLKGDGRTVVFGGVGIYFDRNYWNTLFDEQYLRQFRRLTINFKDSCAVDEFNCAVWDSRFEDPAQLRTLGFATAPEVFLVKNNLEAPRTNQFSAGVRQAIGGYQLTVSYNGIRGYNGMNFIRVSPWGGFAPNYSTIFATDDRVKTWYDAFQLQASKPLAGSRWGGSLAYTLAKMEEQGQSTDLFWGFDDRYTTVADRPRRVTPGDQRHQLVANAIVRLPADFMLSGVVNLGTGIASSATDASAGWGQFTEKTYVYQPPTRAFLGVGHVFNNQNLDIRLEKGFFVRGGQRVSISADLYNSLNSRNFGCYDATIFPTSGNANLKYNKPNCAALGRRLQVGLRYGLVPQVNR